MYGGPLLEPKDVLHGDLLVGGHLDGRVQARTGYSLERNKATAFEGTGGGGSDIRSTVRVMSTHSTDCGVDAGCGRAAEHKLAGVLPRVGGLDGQRIEVYASRVEAQALVFVQETREGTEWKFTGAANRDAFQTYAPSPGGTLASQELGKEYRPIAAQRVVEFSTFHQGRRRGSLPPESSSHAR